MSHNPQERIASPFKSILMTKDRSLLHYSTKDSLYKAICKAPVDRATGKTDWELPSIEEHSTRPQSVIEEFQRLSVMESYNILEAPPQPEFESMTQEAQRYFDVPIAVVSLVDLGRQWFLSIQGLDAKQTPRSCAFCAHVVQRKKECGVLVVKDALEDNRFKDNPLVVGGPKIRFYAGAPLISPEGAILGSFCIIDTKPHPKGLTVQQKEVLINLAEETVLHMISRQT